ncbi:MAG TPA: arginine deiminase-related protein [Anaerolineales bacterium]|nr:arginine deiminase-related protein [Anaerolineales bacterium]
MTHSQEVFNAAAYGGEGWSPRTRNLKDELGSVWGKGGINTEWSRLKAVLLHRPGPELGNSSDPNTVQMLAKIDFSLAQEQHDKMAQAYRDTGVQVHYVEPDGQFMPNQMFVADLLFMTPEGAIVARPASTIRAGEERWVARKLAELGIPIIRSVRGTGTFEGADAAWIDPETVIIGRGLRTNDEGMTTQVTSTLAEMGVNVIQVDMPVGTMHLMGMLRIVDSDLAIAWPLRFVHRGVDALKQHGFQVAFVPHEMEAVHNAALNFVVLGSREILMAAGNPITQTFYEGLGITCHTVEVGELVKAAGAIGCLSGILEREMDL